VIGDIVAELVDNGYHNICMLESRDTTTAVLAASETPATTGQEVVLIDDVQLDEENTPAERKQEAKKDTTLDRPKNPEVTAVTSKFPRGRLRRILVAT